jgi:hypothetical protein
MTKRAFIKSKGLLAASRHKIYCKSIDYRRPAEETEAKSEVHMNNTVI